MIDLLAVFVLVVAGGWASGRWMDLVFRPGPRPLDRWFDPVERALFRLLGVDPDAPMGWRAWCLALGASNLAFGVALFLVLVAQGALPLNPDGIGGMSWHLALHTAVSFLTNTNQQHYSGQAQLSYFGQLGAITAAQVVTPAIGLAAMLAVVRGLQGGAGRLDDRGDPDLGNYWGDVVRAVTRVLLPLATVLAILLVTQGVPATLSGAVHATTLQGAEQVIPVGPVAPMVAIKQLGTNGGGWYGPNSTFPLENPTPLSNVLQLAAILVLPVGCAVLAARRLGAGMGRLTLGSMAAVAILLIGSAVWLESGPNPALAGLAADGVHRASGARGDASTAAELGASNLGGDRQTMPQGPRGASTRRIDEIAIRSRFSGEERNWEGKEVRFGAAPAAAWAAFTTATSNGSVDAMHDSLLPLTGLVPFAGMFVNAAFGGVGVGFVNFVLYVALGVFVAGLLVGRTPELLQRKVEAREMRLVALAVLTPSVCTLVPAALAFALGEAGTSNPGPHGLSQVLYEYASAAANNGSGFEGLGDGTVWWNTSCAAVLALGRYVPMLAPIAVAGLLARKRPAPVTAGTLPLGSPAMIVTVLSVMVLVQLLTFAPALVLGPVAEHLVAVPALSEAP